MNKTPPPSLRPLAAPLLPSLLTAALLLSASGCASLAPKPQPPALPCTLRFKMLTRPEDQARVETAIRAAASGPVSKSGTASFPEYSFHVARLADLGDALPLMMYEERGGLLSSDRRQALNLHAAGIVLTFDSTDVSASASTTVTLRVKPGSRLYFKHPGGAETDITAKVDKTGKVTFPASIREGQKHIYARAVKDSVTRYIRVNIFTNDTQDISRRDYD